MKNTYRSLIVFSFVVVGIAATNLAVTAWELDTIADDSNEISVGSQDGTPFETQFKSDGTKMYVLGYDNDTVYQYSLSSAWDVSSATYDSVSFSVNTQESVPEGMFFKPDGTEMYVIGISGDDVNQYTLSSAWDLSTASYIGVSVSNSGNDNTSVKVHFSGDGTKMYITGFINGRVYQYTLSSAWDVTSASYDSVSFSMLSETSNTYATTFNDTGTRLYGVGPSDVLYQYNLSSAWDVSTAAYASKSYSFNSKDSNSYGIALKADGSKLFLTGATNNKVYRYTANPGDITAPSVSTLAPADEESSVALDENLVITFDENVDVESGNITLKLVSDDSTIEAIDVTGGLVTGTGTSIITIDPTSDLANGIDYYVEIDATAFDDAASNSYAGITGSTTWNFTSIATTGGTSQANKQFEFIIETEEHAPEVVVTCGSPSIANISLYAENVRHYLISNDQSLNAAQWVDMESGWVNVDWEVADIDTEIYYMFKSSFGNLSTLRALDIYAQSCSHPVEDIAIEEE